MSIFGSRDDYDPGPPLDEEQLSEVDPAELDERDPERDPEVEVGSSEDFDAVEADSEHSVEMPEELVTPEQGASSSDLGPYREGAEADAVRAIEQLGYGSVEEFQKAHGARVDGRVGRVTWRLIRRQVN